VHVQAQLRLSLDVRGVRAHRVRWYWPVGVSRDRGHDSSVLRAVLPHVRGVETSQRGRGDVVGFVLAVGAVRTERSSEAMTVRAFPKETKDE
jgi:hypothetical protein